MQPATRKSHLLQAVGLLMAGFFTTLSPAEQDDSQKKDTTLVAPNNPKTKLNPVYTIPAEWQGNAFRLLFGSVDEQAWIYVNGQVVRQQAEKSGKKSFNALREESFIADVPPALLKYGKPNVLAVRVQNSIANGGIWRPVLVQGAMAK